MANFKCHKDGNCILCSSNGECSVTQLHHCRWHTEDSQATICEITNSGENELAVIVSGAPENLVTLDGKKFNGEHKILHHPTANITAIGDFEGRLVIITNVSIIETTAYIRVTSLV